MSFISANDSVSNWSVFIFSRQMNIEKCHPQPDSWTFISNYNAEKSLCKTITNNQFFVVSVNSTFRHCQLLVWLFLQPLKLLHKFTLFNTLFGCSNASLECLRCTSWISMTLFFCATLIYWLQCIFFTDVYENS